MWKTVANVKTILGLGGISLLIAYLLTDKLLETGALKTNKQFAMLLLFLLAYTAITLIVVLVSSVYERSKVKSNVTQKSSGNKISQVVELSKEGKRDIDLVQASKGDGNKQNIKIQ